MELTDIELALIPMLISSYLKTAEYGQDPEIDKSILDLAIKAADELARRNHEAR